MNGQNVRNRRSRSRKLLIVAAVVLFVGLFVQITMLARISGENKRAAKLEKEITRLASDAENLELVINKYHNLEDIEAKARRLGMDLPDETQIRVVSVAGIEGNGAVQTAERIGEEEIVH